MQELTPKQKKKIEKIAKLIEEGNFAIAEHLFEMEEKFDETLEKIKSELPDLEKILQSIKGKDAEPPTKEEVIEWLKPFIPEPIKADDYVLTEDDKKEIAASIPVPIIEKVIEKTEVIRETPIVTENVVEKAVSDTPEQTRDKLETLKDEERLDVSAIKGLDKKDIALADSIIARAIGIVDNRTSYLINKVSDLQNRINTGGSGGASSFLQLSDTPSSYSGAGGQFVKVKAGENGLEFVAGSGGGVAWGDITGTLSDQTDLQSALDDKLNVIDFNLSTFDTGDLAEGSNLYFTDERAQDAVGGMVDSTLVYVDATPVLKRAPITGDVSVPDGSNTATLATVNSNVGSFGSTTQVGTFTVNGKGLITAASNASIAFPTPTAITVANEATDTTCFPLFVTAATGDLGPKSNTNLTYNSNTGALGIGTSAVFTAGTIELGAASDTTLSRSAAGVLAVEGVVIPSISSSNTITNKRIQPRTSSAASGDVSPDLSSANNYYRTALSAGVTINAPTGTPVIGEELKIFLKDDGTSRAITFNATFKFFDRPAPTATTVGKRTYIHAEYDGTDWLTGWSQEI